MARPLQTAIKRPACALGHAGRVWLDGYYARGTLYERPRFQCVPADGAARHKFVEPFAPRHSRAEHPFGTGWGECEHVPDRTEGPRTPWRFSFTLREAAHALVLVAGGMSMREASEKTRIRAARKHLTAWGFRRTSPHGQLSADLISLFAPALTAKLLPPAWPDAIALDALPLQLRATKEDGSPSKASRIGLIVLGAYGYEGGRGKGQVWKFGVRGGQDNVEWESFLRSLPTTTPPGWVVCDGAGAIRKAVRAVWPAAKVYSCEAHLRNTAQEKLALDGHWAASDLFRLSKPAFSSAEGWAAFVAAVTAAKARNTTSWAAKQQALMARQFAMYEPGRPRSIGGLEAALTKMGDRIGTRHYVFRNRARVEAILDLMAIELRGDADERTFAEIIRAAPAARRRRKYERRALDDHDGSSLRLMVEEVEDRLAPARAKAAATWRAYYARNKEKVAAEKASRPSA